MFVVLLIVFGLVLTVALSLREHARFRRRFPPITDANFVARCAPGTNPQVALRVRRIVADQLGVDYDRIYPSSRFVEDLGCS